MGRVGGYRDLVEIEMDGARYWDIRNIVLPAESEAARVTAQEREAERRRVTRGKR